MASEIYDNTILLISENDRLIAAVEQKLAVFGYNVSTPQSITDTLLHSISGNQYSAVIVDIELNGSITAFECARLFIVAHTAPVLFISPESQNDSLEESLQLPVYGYICNNAAAAIIDAAVKTAVRLFESEKKKTGKEKLEIEPDLEKLASQVPGMLYIFKMDSSGQFSVPYSSIRVFDIFGCYPERVENDFSPIMNAIHPDDRALISQTIQESIKNMSQWKCEYRVMVPGREMKWIYGNSIPEQQKDGSIVWHGYNVDITTRKKAEEEVKRQLDEKVVLLREVHHRIKNNLASISGLLSIQADSAVDSKIHEELQHAVSRVQSMQLLYSKLLIDGEYDTIDIDQYLESLIETIISIYEEKVVFTIQTNFEPLKISSRKAFPLGIIVNELLTNTIKYAFDKSDNGAVTCDLSKTGDTAVLTLRDNGRGFCREDIEKNHGGFGLSLVEMLASQINGSFAMDNSSGTRSTITFTLK